jgi:phosphatidylserine/phosphatidylglycerophosphate/cardiolipin synthase-like enzyme
VTRDKRLVKEANALFEADRCRQPYSPGYERLVVSPETSREILTAFIRKAKKQLLIYDAQISDNLILRVIQDRARAGVEIRVIGKIEKSVQGVESRKLSDMRLHVRAMIRDGGTAFVGSQSLRKLELDGRREIGLIVNDSRIAKKMAAVFEADWALALANGKAADKEKEKEKEKEREEATPASAVG